MLENERKTVEKIINELPLDFILRTKNNNTISTTKLHACLEIEKRCSENLEIDLRISPLYGGINMLSSLDEYYKGPWKYISSDNIATRFISRENPLTIIDIYYQR
ncbi:MAG: hypothetical protein KKF65_06700 [Nanoarchaeota archaeon]|nr:hypothetical protein [Nanoarchaeota archaeon]